MRWFEFDSWVLLLNDLWRKFCNSMDIIIFNLRDGFHDDNYTFSSFLIKNYKYTNDLILLKFTILFKVQKLQCLLK